MAKQKKKSESRGAAPIGEVLTDLALWEFSEDDDIIRHYADQLAKAIQMHYHLRNFGTSSFGLGEEE